MEDIRRFVGEMIKQTEEDIAFQRRSEPEDEWLKFLEGKLQAFKLVLGFLEQERIGLRRQGACSFRLCRRGEGGQHHEMRQQGNLQEPRTRTGRSPPTREQGGGPSCRGFLERTVLRSKASYGGVVP